MLCGLHAAPPPPPTLPGQYYSAEAAAPYLLSNALWQQELDAAAMRVREVRYPIVPNRRPQVGVKAHRGAFRDAPVGEFLEIVLDDDAKARCGLTDSHCLGGL